MNKVSVRNGLDRMYLDTQKHCYEVSMLGIVLLKNGSPGGKWGRRVASFIAGPPDVFEVHDC